MLNTQVEYWKLQESKRHNVATEQLSRDQLGFSYAQLAEDTRHHQADERQNYYSYLETSRHNKASEDIAYRNIDLGYANLSELSTHNRAMEDIGRTQARASLISASASVMQAKAAQTTAAANLQNAQTNAQNAQTRIDELSIEREKAEHINALNKAKTKTEKANRRLAYAQAKANRAKQEYTDIQSSWYAVDQIRSWVPIINLGGNK